MSFKKLYNQAKRAHAKFEQASQTAKTAEQNRESCLRTALLYVRKVSEALDIWTLSENKETVAEAWAKAVVLLGSNGRAMPDLILHDACSYWPPARFQHLHSELEKKRKLICGSATATELERLWQSDPRKFSAELQNRLDELAEQCQTLEALTEMCDRYRAWIPGEYRDVLHKHRNRLFSIVARRCRSLQSLEKAREKYSAGGILIQYSGEHDRIFQENADRIQGNK